MPPEQECVDCDSEVPMETLNPGENTSSLIELHDEIESRRGSITHPYRSLMNETGFPRCHRVAAPPISADSYDMQIYTRTMLRQGNGTPLWDPIGNRSTALTQFRNSIVIGDVGLFEANGSFRYYFNIFLPATHPAQYRGLFGGTPSKAYAPPSYAPPWEPSFGVEITPDAIIPDGNQARHNWSHP